MQGGGGGGGGSSMPSCKQNQGIVMHLSAQIPTVVHVSAQIQTKVGGVQPPGCGKTLQVLTVHWEPTLVEWRASATLQRICFHAGFKACDWKG